MFKKIVDEFGGATGIGVVVIVLIVLISEILKVGGVVDTSFTTLIQDLFDKIFNAAFPTTP